MSLNNISLPATLVADLYQNALVSATARAMPVKEPALKPLPFLGKNGKNILVVVNKPNAPYLPDEELAFLTKVLSACGLGLMDVAIVNWSRLDEPNAATLLEETAAKSVILFDVEPGLFGLTAVPPFVAICDRSPRAPSLPGLPMTNVLTGSASV